MKLVCEQLEHFLNTGNRLLAGQSWSAQIPFALARFRTEFISDA